MTIRKSLINWPAIVLAVAFCALAGYQTMAMRELARLQPAVVATVDIERVFAQIEERVAAEGTLDTVRQQARSETEAKARALRALEEELELHPTTSDKYQEILERLSLQAHDYRAFVEFSRRKIEFEEAQTLRRIYGSIKAAIRDEASSNGYDIVFVNDSLGEVPMADVAETSRQISARRMLYTNPALDITDAIVARMNAAFKAGAAR